MQVQATDAMVDIKNKMITAIDNCNDLHDMIVLADILEWVADIMAGQGYAYKVAELAQRMYDCIVLMLWEDSDAQLERLYHMIQSFRAKQSAYMNS